MCQLQGRNAIGDGGRPEMRGEGNERPRVPNNLSSRQQVKVSNFRNDVPTPHSINQWRADYALYKFTEQRADR